MKEKEKIERLAEDWTFGRLVQSTHRYDEKSCKESFIAGYEAAQEWIKCSDEMPTETGKYCVYRQSDGKQHREKFNGSGWSVNHNIITHWQHITPPKQQRKG